MQQHCATVIQSSRSDFGKREEFPAGRRDIDDRRGALGPGAGGILFPCASVGFAIELGRRQGRELA